MNLFDQYQFLALISHLNYVNVHINYILFSTCFLLDMSFTIYVRLHNVTATLKLGIDIDREDSKFNFTLILLKSYIYYPLKPQKHSSGNNSLYFVLNTYL